MICMVFVYIFEIIENYWTNLRVKSISPHLCVFLVDIVWLLMLNEMRTSEIRN